MTRHWAVWLCGRQDYLRGADGQVERFETAADAMLVMEVALDPTVDGDAFVMAIEVVG